MHLDVIVPVERSSFVVVHYHIFKNSGTTIEEILEREFPGRFAKVHGRDSDSILEAEDLLEFLQQHPEVMAVSSHHFRYPKPRRQRTVFFDCCFLRDPIERLYSCYRHFRRSGQDDVCSHWARSYSPREFVAQLIEEAPHQVSDVQVNQLGNAGAFVRPADERDLERATAIVRDMALPGLVEMFDESMVAGEYYLHPAFPNLRLEYLPKNVSYAATITRPKLQMDWQEIWGSDMHEHLLRMNALDLELLRRTRSEILRRLDGIPRFSDRLADFRSRCARLASASNGHNPTRPFLVPLVEVEPLPRRLATAAGGGGVERA